MGKKFSEISPASAAISALDSVVGIQSGEDVLYSRQQLGVRTLLTADLTINVPADYATRQLAYNAACTLYDSAGYNMIILIASGTYTDVVNLEKQWTGGGQVHFIGDPATPGNVILNANDVAGNFTVSMPLPAAIVIDGFKVTNAGGGGICHNSSGLVFVGAMEYGACAAPQILADCPGGFVYLSANYEISGDATYHIFGAYGAKIFGDSLTVTLTGAPTFDAFINSINNAIVYYTLMTFVGSASGLRFVVEALAQIDTFEAGLAYLPGSALGYSRGGQYL